MTEVEFYEEIATQFPATWPTDPQWTWVNVHDGVEPRLDVLLATLDRYIHSAEVVVVAHSTPGTAFRLSKEAACQFIGSHLLKSEVQVTDPQFRSFVLVSTSGVATGWSSKFSSA